MNMVILDIGYLSFFNFFSNSFFVCLFFWLYFISFIVLKLIIFIV